MVNDTLKRELIKHKIYSSWQFIEYTEKNIATVRYCADTIDNLVKKMAIQTVRWEQDIASDFIDDITEDGRNVRRLSVTTDNFPTYEVSVVGEKIDPWFLFDKLLRDFFQYAMNSFDSMSQIVNAGLLANKSKKVDSVDIQKMVSCFSQQTYKTAFPRMHEWLDKLSQSKKFKYIEAINNRTKHTADISNKLSMGILGSSNTAEVGPFFRKDVQHDKRELNDLLQATLDFITTSWYEFLDVFKTEYKNDIFVQNRIHKIAGVRQQHLKNKPDQDSSYAYIDVEGDFDSMPEELYILLVRDDGEICSHQCPFKAILVIGKSNTDILGRYITESIVGDDCLLHYRKYIKDKDVKGIRCMIYTHQEKTIFYKKNPYFIVESISDEDEQFLIRTTLPF